MIAMYQIPMISHLKLYKIHTSIWRWQFPSDVEGPEFAKVNNWFRDANGIPIGTNNYNSILENHVCEVDYLDGRKAELAANTTTEYIIAQIDDKGHRFLHLYAIDDYRVIR